MRPQTQLVRKSLQTVLPFPVIYTFHVSLRVNSCPGSWMAKELIQYQPHSERGLCEQRPPFSISICYLYALWWFKKRLQMMETHIEATLAY